MNRRFTARTLGVFAALLLASCIGDGTGPLETRPGQINIAPDFNVRGIHSVDVNRVLIRFVRPNTTVLVYETIVPFPASTDTLDLNVQVPINGQSEQFLMTILMIDDPAGDTVFQAGPTLITATAGGPPPNPPTPITFTYVGVGAKAAGVRFVTTPTQVLFGDTVVFTAEAFDSNNVVIPNTPIEFRSSDTTRARVPVDSIGRVIGGIARGPVTITAALLTPPTATTGLLIQPKPNAVVVQGGTGQTGAVGAQLSQPVTVRVNAADNLGVAGVIVNFAVSSGGGSLSALVDTTDANGDASVIWTLGSTLGAQSVSATAPAVSGGNVTVPATGVVGTVKKLAFQVQPTNVQVNASITPAVKVMAQDTFGNLVTSYTGAISVAIGANPGASTLSGTTPVNAVAGVATFSNLSLNNLGNGYTLTAAATGLTGATSSTFDVAGGVPFALVITQEPSNTQGGVAITPALAVQVRDAFNTLVPGATNTITVTILTNPAGGALSGTTSVAAVGGTATFPTISIDKAGSGYTLLVSSGGLTPDTSVTFDISSGPAQVLSFTTQPPANAIFGSPFVTVVSALDAGGNVAAGFTGAVTLAIAGNPAGGTLSGTTTVNAVAGVATFSGVSIDNIGNPYTLSANATGLTGTASGGFLVIAPANANAWINSAGGNWSVASNWSKGTVPNATDTIFIRQSGNYTVNLDVNSAALARLDVGAPFGAQALQVAGNTLTLTGNGAFTANANLQLNGGTVAGAGTLDLFGGLFWSAGSISGGGGIVRVHGTINVSGAGGGRQLSAHALELAGTGVWNTSGGNMSSGNGALLRVLTGGQLDLTGDAGMVFNLGGTVTRLQVQSGGTLRRTLSAGNIQFNTAVDDSGSVQVLTGTLTLDQGGLHTGAFSVSSGATLVFGTGTHNLAASTSVTGAGTVLLNGNATNAFGPWTITGQITVGGGTLLYNAATGSTVNLDVNQGVLGGAAGGVLTVSGAMTWSNGSLTGTGGTVRVLNSGSLAISGTATRNLSGYNLELAGSGTWTGTNQMQSGNGASLKVLGGATLDIQGDATFLFNLGGVPTIFQNLGTIARSVSAGPVVISTQFDNDGQLNINTGTFTLSGGTGAGTADGVYSVAAPAILDFSANTHNLGAAGTVTGAGIVRTSGSATVNAAGAWTVTGVTRTLAGTLNLNTNATIPTLDVAGGVMGGTGTVSVSGAMTWSAGDLSGGNGTALVLGTLAVTGSGGRSLSAHTLEVAGNGTWNTTGSSMNSGNAGFLRITTGGLLDVQGDFGMTFNLGGAPSAVNVAGGTFRRSTSANPVAFVMQVNDSGLVQVNTGTLQLNAGGTSTGQYAVNGTATLSFGGGTHNLVAGSGVSGAGTSFVAIPAGTVNAGNFWVQNGTTLVNGGVVNFNGATMFTSVLNVTAGTLGGSGLMSVSGAMTWTGGNLSGAGGTTSVDVSGSLAMSPNANFTNYTLEIAGSGTWSGLNTINTGAAAVLRILPGGSLNITGAPSFTQNLGGGATILDNQGTLLKNTNASAANMSVVFNSSGAMSLNIGQLNLLGGGSLSGSVSTISGGSLAFSGGTFTLATPFDLTGAGIGAVTGTGVVTTATAADSAKFSNLILNGGTLNQTGVIRANLLFGWQAGNVTGTGKVYIAPGSLLQMTTAAARIFTNGVIENDGGATWNATFALNTGGGAVMRNLPGRTFVLSADPTFTQNQGGALTTFDNQGTFNRTTSAGTSTWSVAFNHTAGTLNVSTGVFSLGGGGLIAAPVTVTSPAFLDLASGTFTGTNALNATGTGAVRLQGATIATATASDTARFTNLTLVSGNLSQTGGVVVNSVMDWNNGAGIIGTGTTRIANTATMTITGAASRLLTNGVLLNQGSTNWSGAGAINTGLGAIWRNAAAATFILSGDGGFTLNQGGAATFDNLAAFTRNTSGGTATWTAAFNHSSAASMAINTGVFSMNGGGTQSAGATVASGAFLDFGAGSFTLNNGYTETGTGVVRLQNATITNATVADTARFAGMQLNGGTLNHIGGIVIQGTGSAVDWAGGTSISGTGTMRISNLSTMTVSGTASRTLTRGVLLNQGTTNWTGTLLINSGIGIIWRNAVGANLNVSANNPSINLNQGGAATIDNLGTVTRSVGPAGWVVNVAVSGNGAWNVTGGTLDMQGGGTVAGATAVSAGATLLFNNNTFVYSAPITGAGTMNVNGGTVNLSTLVNIGTLTLPGGVLNMNGSAVTVTGNFSTAGAGALNMTNVTDSLDIAGNATFGGGGTLNAGVIRLAGNFIQTGGGTFQGQAQSAAVAHRVVIDGVSGAQTISFADPVNSFFRRLWISKGSGTCTFLTNAKTTYYAQLGGTYSCSGVAGPPITRLTADTVAGNPSGSVSMQSPWVLVANVANIIDSNIINVDTVVFAGNAQTIRTTVPGLGAGNYTFKSIRVAPSAGTVTIGQATLNMTNDLVVSAGTLNLNNNHVGVTGNFRTEAGGVLQMVNINDSLGVGGNATFGGGGSAGLLTRGVISLLGNFTQSGAVNSYAPVSAVGSHRVRLDGSGAQNINFADPVNSFFDVLAVTATTNRNIVLQTNAQVGDTIIMAAGGAKSSLIGAGTSQRLRVNGVVRMTSSTQSALLAPPVLDLAGILSLDSIFQALTGVNPDTLVYLAGTTFFTGSPVHYKSARIATSAVTSFTSGNNETIAGDLSITAGTLALSGTGQLLVTGDLLVNGTGVLRMQSASSFLEVDGDATFSGPTTATQMSNGTLRLKGNFTNTTAAGFQASGLHVTQFNGPVGVASAIQTVTMTNPGTGAGQSRFNRLALTRANAGSALEVKINLLSDVQAGNVVDTSQGRFDSIMGTGAVTLTTDSIQLNASLFNNLPVVVTNTGFGHQANTVRFENMNPVTTYLSFTRTNTSVGLSFSNFNFFTPRTGAGRYLNVTTTGANATGAFVSFTTSTTGGTFLAANNDYTRAFTGASTQLPTISFNGTSNP